MSQNKYSNVLNINKLIRSLDNRFRRNFPILGHQYQNTLCLVIFLLSIVGIIGNGYLFYIGLIPAWLCVVANGILASFLHELEHDLIHYLYFNKQKFIQNILFIGIWIFRGNLLSPWYRREIHLRHHRESGQKTDIEERLIGNGMKWNLGRLIISIDPSMTLFRLHSLKKEIPDLSISKILFTIIPMPLIFNSILWMFIFNNIYALYSGELFFGSTLSTILYIVFIANILPNIIRQFCLSVISSNCHYYGNVERNNLFHQTQVLHPWYLFPLQIFCFNFGSTHIIHHFVVNQPFYLRQLVAPWVHKAFAKSKLIQFNDIKSIIHANRRYIS